MAQEKKEESEGKKGRLSTGAVIAMITVFVIATVAIAQHFYFSKNNDKKSDPEIITESTLTEILDVSDMYVYQTAYNGIAWVMNEKNPEKVDYYVAYEATVKAGFDFKDIDISVEDNTVTVTLPPIEIKDDAIFVEAGSLDYIFENKKADTETVFAQAYAKCIEDAREECKADDAIRQSAEENAKRAIRGMIAIFAEDYNITIN